jgi:predicted DNA-binding protein
MADKTNLVALRLNDEQMQAINLWSKQHEVTVSQVIRAAIEQMTGAKS